MVVLAVLVAAAVSAAVSGLALIVGRRIDVVDTPDGDLKPHSGSPVPLGGLGLLAGLHIGMAVLGLFEPGLLMATLAAWGVGVYDDYRPLSPAARIALVVAIGVVVAITGPAPGGLIVSILVVVLVLGMVNAINLVDGLDLMAPTVGAATAVGLVFFGALRDLDEPFAPLALMGALLGFMVWNYPPARMFLGDNGAYVLGVALSWHALALANDWGSGLVAVAILGIALLETAVTVLRRRVAGVSLTGGDRDHTYDRMHQAGMSVVAVVAIFAGAQLLWSGMIIGLVELIGESATALAAAAIALALAVTIVSISSKRGNGLGT